MSQTLQNPLSTNPTSVGFKVWLGAITFVLGIAIFQDFLFSQIRNTGFYISESLLYNTIWVFLIPLGLLQLRILSKAQLPNKMVAVAFRLLSSGILGGVHIILFTSFFILASNLFFSPAHRFTRIFHSVLASELSTLILLYFALPFIIDLVHKKSRLLTEKEEYLNKIKVKTGSKTVHIDVQDVSMISAKKPYTYLKVGTENFLDDRSLKDFESILDPSIFYRVHRSMIVNRNYVKELRSRNNGDYDAILENGAKVRLSRHLRSNWANLLH